MNTFNSKNIFGEKLITCSEDPLTGFFRNGCCDTGPEDRGKHLVCAVMTSEFLQFSKSRGNDLTTPIPMYNFPGLADGDRWCLCALRWKEAYDAGMAPKVVLEATNESVLKHVPMEALLEFAHKDESVK
ncbi:MAG: DUF2237 domain-containing protein [Balneolaceae bacterium]|nr:MAG: DUF2237 domain-containing protein [Balneolaceae bacterium]